MKFTPLCQVARRQAAASVVRRLAASVCLAGLPWLTLGCGPDGTPPTDSQRTAPPMLGKGSTSTRGWETASHADSTPAKAVIQISHVESNSPKVVLEVPRPDSSTPKVVI